jgi:heptaprenyl diphosphate synthase
VVIFGIMIALSSVVYVVEGLIPFPVPGGKWGFSNFLVLYMSVFSGLSDAVLLAVSKSLLGSILSGTIKFNFLSVFGISFLGMVTNNLVQFVIGSFLIGSNAIFIFLPLVMTLGTFSAFANAFLAVKTHGIVKDFELNQGVGK